MAYPVHAAVVINEIYPKPSGEESEWIELYNNGPASVSLDRWKLQNTSGAVSTFTMNASSIVAANSFLTLPQSQTGISLNDEGDNVTLLDVDNNQVDTQGYPSILGFNTSVGRTVDGGGVWALCITPATPNAPNNCPQPSPTATPFPTSTPMPTSTPTPKPKADRPLADTVSPPQTFGAFVPGTAEPTPQPPDETQSLDVLIFRVSKSRIAYVLLGIAAGALSLMFWLWLRRRQIRRNP